VPTSDDVPDQLARVVRVITRGRDLRPVAALRTERHLRRLRDGDGVVAAELTDDVVNVVDSDGKVAAKFRELELEVVGTDAEEGPPDSARQIVADVSELLVASGAVGGETTSKAIRALGPRAAYDPEIREPDPVSPKDPARAAVAAHLARHTIALRAADVMVRRDHEDGVHQIRVAARRLRSGLRVFRPLLDREWADDLRAELKWLASTMGEYRDTQVMLARLIEHCGELPTDLPVDKTRNRINTRLSAQLQQARTDVLGTLDSPRYLALHDRLVAAAANPEFTEVADQPCRKALPPLVIKAWRRLESGSEQLLDDEVRLPGGAPDEEWHALRIVGKKARYCVEAVAPVFGPDAAALAKKLSKVTDVLGEHQDAAVAAEAVHDLMAGRVDGQVAFALGALQGVERAHGQDTRAEYKQLWADVSRKKYRRWLDQ
jgi:CHAD domain-containing protein